MVDVAVTSQLSQWTFDKPAVTARPQRTSTDSSASSPNLCDDAPETLRINTAAKEGRVFQERYLSSEEDLTADDNSGSESEYDYDDVVVHDLSKECKARTMSISRWDKGRSCDMAVAVSYAHAGRPKMVEMEAAADRPSVQQRSASVANMIPITAASKLRKADEAQRLSMKVMPTTRLASPPLSRSASPPAIIEPRRPSTSHSPITQRTTTFYPDSASISSSSQTASSRSFSPAPSDAPRRPSSSAAGEAASARSSLYMPTRSRLDLSRIQTSQSSYQSSNRQSHLSPLTPQSPALSFLSSDPYENSNSSAASPIIKKPATHRRLRSISMKLSLAKIAISPAKKQLDPRINGKAPPTPITPGPTTPQTAPLDGSANFANPNKIRRASTMLRPKSRGAESARRSPTPDVAPPMPQVSASTTQQKRSTTMGRLVARGANEREPTLVLPECPDAEDDPMSSVKSRAIRRRKSLMDFMDSL
ncbi:hypothetical protein DDE82_007298 [Stemphylium lycopersici]|uniref:Uncharacterized protein n=1 Tax=Stemphylium lycopersici TaxID=183478 RepID=A0A364MUM0_STELY|nr:hypothetical protein TW65_00997 [Stemphylium lycopersici]RAR00463.1 hypothetical protein DDE82_007298 [Stemphylium lycopersici]RAR04037.1 hypothetical protein DDE83_007975 [Stemphylium lycopersici]